MPPKSLFRQPGAKHFQLVHRSQRDPLINDPEASIHVLKPFERENAKKGKFRADLQATLSPEDTADPPTRIGEASLYGVYFDDTEYDYMQHLRPVGLREDGVDSILIEAPSISRQNRGRSTLKASFEIADLPDGVLPSSSELPRTYESQQAIPESIAGFQPDMDAHLRQVLEALEDDAFVENGLEDDFFHQLVADGERGSDEEFNCDYTDEGYGENLPDICEPADEGRIDWEKRFSAFKKTQIKESSDDEYTSEGGDTIGTLHTVSVIGGKKRRKGKSDASCYSMSSSSMYRNEALQTLDERFDQMILKHYKDDNHDVPDDDDNEEAPQLITSREDFDSMVNEFLNDFEILGRKMKPKLEGESGPEKLEILRRAMGQDERVWIVDSQDNDDNDPEDLFPSDDEDKKDAWDCETILTTYTNLENHPRLIRAQESNSAPRIVLDRKTGLPSILDSHQTKQKTTNPVSRRTDSDDSDDTEGDSNAALQTITRPRNESKEEKKARKAVVKAERQARRVKKKSMKEQFGAETKDQKKRIGNKELRLKKL